MIRKMEKGDLKQVLQIEEATFTQPWTEEGFESAISMENNHYIVMEVDGEIVGYCGLYGVLDEGEITNVAVKESCRNKGYGAKLVEELLAIAEEANIKRVVLEVRVSNESAKHVYRKIGFVDLGIRKGFYEMPVEDALIMEWEPQERK